MKSLREIGKLIGVSQSYLSQVKTGKRALSAKVLNKLTEEMRTAVLPAPPSEPEREKIYTPYPDLKIMPYTVIKKTRDTEDIGIVWADHHAGRKTSDTEYLGQIVPGYSVEKYKQRMDMLLKSVMRVIELHKPIRKAWILDLGDDVQGENMFQGTTITACDISVYDQIYELACPVQARFCASLLQEVEEVEVVKVPGNHGNYQKVQPAKTNWDIFLGKALQDSLVNNPKIKVRMTGDFCDLVTIQGFRFFIMHGDQVMANQGIPLFALRRKYQEYFALYQFHYAYNGHFHAGYHDQVNSVSDYTGCPPLVTGDEWALKKIGRASKPIQLCFGVHNKKGRSFNYTLHTDSDYLPRPDFK